MTNQELSLRLGLVLALAENCKCDHWHLQSLLDKLSCQAQKQLRKLPRLTASEVADCLGRYRKFGEKIGWEKGEAHAMTFASLCLGILEDCEGKWVAKMLKTINEITALMEAWDHVSPEAFDEGGRAVEEFLNFKIIGDKRNETIRH
jgi:hypothetical protein